MDNDGAPPHAHKRRGYIHAILDAGGVPLLLPPGVDGDVLRHMYDAWRNRQDHVMTIAPTSCLATWLGTTEAGANSLHHQVLHMVSPQLRVVTQAPDGVVEAIEGPSEAFVLGVQCHPEQLWDGSDQCWRNVFRAFVEAAGARKKHQRSNTRT